MKKLIFALLLVGNLLPVSSSRASTNISFGQTYNASSITKYENLPFIYNGLSYSECYATYNSSAHSTTFYYYNPDAAPTHYDGANGGSWQFTHYTTPNDYLAFVRYSQNVNSEPSNYFWYSPTIVSNPVPAVNFTNGSKAWSYYDRVINPIIVDFPLLPFDYNNQTYTKKIVGFDFNSTYTGYERELYAPSNSDIWINHSVQGLHGDLLATGVFTGNANETISAHNGVLESPNFHSNINLNETINCFATIKSNTDIRWTTNNGQYGSLDNCGNYHEEGDLVVPKNLNADGTEPTNMCIYPSYCTFPDFANTGANIRDRNNTSDYVYMADVFEGVPSYLNSQNDGGGYGSYYQCTEYVAKYLRSKFGTDYTDKKNVNDTNTQGFRGYDFHPNYGGNPTVDKGGQAVNLVLVYFPKAGDIAMFSSGHAAVVKSTNGNNATLIEQNYIFNGKYTINRTVDTSTAEVAFFRYPAVVVSETSSISSTIQDAYNSTATGQSIKMQSQIFNENLDFSNNVLVTLLGGYDPNFQTQSGWTTIFGSLIIRSGTVIIDYICIQ